MALLTLVACGAGAGAGKGREPERLAPPAAQAGSGDRAAADFYRGKTLRLVVGYDAGGGYDTYSRVIARYLGKHVPGNPNVIVENRPGAGGLVATNYLANAAPKDGTVLLNVGASSMLKQLAGDRGVEYDAARFQYLGAPFSDHNILIVRKSSGFTRLDEALGAGSRQMVLGGISPGSPQDVGAVLVRDVLGANVKLVSGYGGTSKIRLALDQGEIDGFFNAWESTRATNRAEIDSGDWVVLAQVTERPLPDFPAVPTLLQLARTDEQRQVIRMASIAPLEFARPYLVAAGVPDGRVVALRTAFDQTMADPEFWRTPSGASWTSSRSAPTACSAWWRSSWRCPRTSRPRWSRSSRRPEPGAWLRRHQALARRRAPRRRPRHGRWPYAARPATRPPRGTQAPPPVAARETHGHGGGRQPVSEEGARRARLAAQAQPADERPVALLVLAAQVVEHPPPLADEHEQAAARVVILLVYFEVLLQVADSLRKDRDLHLGRARIVLGPRVVGHQRLLGLSRERHARSASSPNVAACRWRLAA